MTELKVDTANVKVQSGDIEIDAYLATPSLEGSYPGIVVIQEIFGVNDHIRDVTRRLAREGYCAIAPAIYQRQAPGFETGYTPEDIKIGRQYKVQTKASELLDDVRGAINYLKTLDRVKKDRFGCIGFCFGGHVAYLAATLPDIAATASFYGAGIATLTPGGGEPTITRTSAIQGTLYAFFGMEDASIPPEEVNQIEAELKKHDIPHQLFRYPDAGHGFFCDRRASYHEEAAVDAWRKVLQLFAEQL
ncbi:dienelactone hydrolase family protein [Lusitaniella coriacea LEGE 07157]|uniref:Dienelactone hydrolase family protein n=1 Tax=Lusitaniella coriacea LEGE 07157 TaxID=945747 RepID=A0A8J7DXK4_9CYAN|nr:dienelactone hydrolase family protein [Lusitaniella coriacea]MBE9117008.1 dienelactone hydrolase family protein [Lusitaniella coriacea LEGE 07157]